MGRLPELITSTLIAKADAVLPELAIPIAVNREQAKESWPRRNTEYHKVKSEMRMAKPANMATAAAGA